MKKIRDGYKITEIGEIPEEWYISKLSELAQIKRGASPRPINNPKWFSEKKNVGWIRISDVTKTKKYLNSTEQYLSDEGVAKSRLVKPNDLIMSICATVGKPIILNIDACIHDGFILFDDLNNSKIITDYLYYLLQKKEEEFKGMGQTGTQANLNTNIVGSTLIAIPTIKEQKKIASILSTVDKQIDNVDALIEKNKELKKGLMQTLLTKGIGHTKFKKTEIGEVPSEWYIKSIDEITKEVYRYPTYYGIEYVEEGIAEIRGELLNDDASIKKESFRYISEKTAKKFPRTKLEGGDIVISVRGTIGKVGYITEELAGSNITANLLRVSMNRNIMNEHFVKQLFLSDIMKRKFDEITTATTIKTFKVPEFKQIILAIPTKDEQDKIASILLEVDNKIEETENKKQQLEELKKGLMQQLLTGRIRV